MMGTETLNKGDLMCVNNIGHNSYQIYGILIHIIDKKTRVDYDTKEIITGRGPENTRVELHIQQIAKSKNWWRDLGSVIEDLNNDECIISIHDPHNISKVSIDELKEKWEKLNISVYKQFTFLSKFFRNEKIDEILK